MSNNKNFIAKNGVSTGDGYSMPDIRPSLLLDFANSKTLDPRITFTRGSTATYWDGHTTTKAEENLTERSQNFANAYWTKADVTVTEGATAPDGTTTAATLESALSGDTSQAVYHLMNPVPQIGASVSIYAKEGTTEFFGLQAGTSAPNALFNLNTGAVLHSSGCTATITSVGNGWYRCALENITSSTSNYIMMSPVGSNIGTGDAWGNNDAQAGDNVLIWGVQLENRSSPTAYTATGGAPIVKYQPTLQTAASGEARFDHDPVTGESKGLLIEEARTNLVTDSVVTSSSDNNGISFEANAAVAPDGNVSAALITSDSTNDGHYAYYEDFLRTSGNAITISIFVKPLSMSRGYIWLGSGSSALPNNIVVDTSDWTISDSNGTASSVTEVGNGWYRISTTGTATATGTAQIYCGFIAASTYSLTNYVGDPSDRMLLWGFQAETGSFPTSYIPTSGSTVVRSTDVFNMPLSGIYSSGPVSMYVEAAEAGDVNYARLVLLSDGTNENRMQITISESSGDVQAYAETNDVPQASLNRSFDPAYKTFFKAAAAFDRNNLSVTAGGLTTVSDTLIITPQVTNLYLGSLNGTDADSGATFKKVALYPTRLSNATLQAMTEE